jgi:hypothetical protein
MDLIQDTAIPMAIIGLLWSLPNTQLTRRLAREGRLHANAEFMPKGSTDQLASGLNFETKRPRLDILRDFRRVLATSYTPEAYCGRIDRLVSLLDCSGRRHEMAKGDPRAKLGTVNIVQEILRRMPEHRDLFWRTFTNCLNKNPGALRAVVILMGFYLHIGPYTRFAIQQIDDQIEELEQGRFVSPQMAPPDQAQPMAVNA